VGARRRAPHRAFRGPRPSAISPRPRRGSSATTTRARSAGTASRRRARTDRR
jgi:hypothetical protein